MSSVPTVYAAFATFSVVLEPDCRLANRAKAHLPFRAVEGQFQHNDIYARIESFDESSSADL